MNTDLDPSLILTESEFFFAEICFVLLLVLELGSDPTIHVGENTITFTGEIPQRMIYLPAITHAMNQDRPSSYITVRYVEVRDTPIGLKSLI